MDNINTSKPEFTDRQLENWKKYEEDGWLAKRISFEDWCFCEDNYYALRDAVKSKEESAEQ